MRDAQWPPGGTQIVFLVALLLCAWSPSVASPTASAFPELYGVGVLLVQEDSTRGIFVRECTLRGPAERAGVLPGDALTALDGADISTWPFERVRSHLVREEPGPVDMTVRRRGQEFTFQVARQRIADIAANAGRRWIASADSAHYQMAASDEVAQVLLGAVIATQDVRNARCESETLSFAGSGPVLVYFWARQCGPCKSWLDWLRQAATSNIQLIGISVDSECETMRATVGTVKPPGNQYWAGGWYGSLAQQFGLRSTGIPTAAMIDGRGKLLATASGTDSLKALYSRYAKQYSVDRRGP